MQNDGFPSAYTKAKLVELLERGVNITVASARSVISIQQVLEGVRFRLPVIEINGAFISDFATGEHLIINDLDKEIAADIYSRILRHNCACFASAFNGTEDCLYYQRIINEGMGFYHNDRVENGDKRLRGVSDIKKTFKDYIVAFTVINRYENLRPLANEIESDLADELETHFFENPYSPSWWWLTIHDKMACKSKAVKMVVDSAGLKMEDLTVFGDNLNDVKMFQTAGRAIAVANATDEIKSFATEVIGTNEDDSVIKFIANETS